MLFSPDRGEPAVLPLHEPSHRGARRLRHHRGVCWGSADHGTAPKPGLGCQDAAARCLQQDVFGRQRPPESHQRISERLLPEVQVGGVCRIRFVSFAAPCCSKFGPFCLGRRFFLAACDVPSLEDKFNVDQYSDLVTVSKPVIYISIGEMINTHTVSVAHGSLAAAKPAPAAALRCCRDLRLR